MRREYIDKNGVGQYLLSLRDNIYIFLYIENDLIFFVSFYLLFYFLDFVIALN